MLKSITVESTMIKSITAVQNKSTGHGGWDVRIRTTDGNEKLVSGEYPWTLHQAQLVAINWKRDCKIHGFH